MEFDVSQINPKEIRKFWTYVRVLLLPSITMYEGEPTEPEIVESLENEERYLWVAYEPETTNIVLAMITQFRTIKEVPILMFEYVGGKNFIKLMPKYLPQFYEYARNNGCQFVCSYSIPTIAKVLAYKYKWLDAGETKLGHFMVMSLYEKEAIGEKNEDLYENCY